MGGGRPKMVVWFFFEGNDLGEMMYENRLPLYRTYLSNWSGQGLKSRQTELDQYIRERFDTQFASADTPNGLMSTSYLDATSNLLTLFTTRRRLAAIANAHRNARDTCGDNNSLTAMGRYMQEIKSFIDLHLFHSIVSKMAFISTKMQSEFVIAYVPDRSRFQFLSPCLADLRTAPNISFSPPLTNWVREIVRSTASAHGVRFIDLTPAIAALPKPTTAYARHFNRTGYQAATDYLLEQLEK